VLKEMKAYKHLKPGQAGTKRLMEKYGDSLICVRYRYDEVRGIKMKTVEIAIEETPWSPAIRFTDGDIVPVAVAYEETALRDKLRAMRARWDSVEKLWFVPYRFIRGTELEKRIPEAYLNGSKRL
jgi:hypothetical protein